MVDRGAAPRFGSPVDLNLEGRGIRTIASWQDAYWIVGGDIADPILPSRLYRWDGTEPPVWIDSVHLRDLNIEAIATIATEVGPRLLLLSDDGTRHLRGRRCKKLRDPAASARPMEELIVDQMKYLAAADGSVTAEESDRIRSVTADLATIRKSTFSASSAPVFGVAASYWLDLKTYDAVSTARKLDRPLFVLQGGRDYQVTRVDFAMWQKGLQDRKRCAFRVYDDLNHLLIAGVGPSVPAEYGRPGHVAEVVVSDIAVWIDSLAP